MDASEGLTLPFQAKCVDGFFHFLSEGVTYEVECVTDTGEVRYYHVRNNKGDLAAYLDHRFEIKNESANTYH